MAGDLTIRKLTVADNRRLEKMIRNLIKTDEGQWLQHIVSAAKSEGKGATDEPEEVLKYYRLFGDIIDMLFNFYHTDIEKWFASLIGVEVDAYQDLPFDTDMVIVEQLKEAPEFKSFFSKACAVFKASGWLKNIISSVKEKFDSISD